MAYPQQYSLRTLLFKQLLFAVSLAFIISLLITLIPAYTAIQKSINEDVTKLEKLGYQAINQHLTTGWQPANINRVYQNLRQNLPEAALFLQKAPQYLDSGDDTIRNTGDINRKFIKLIQQVEQQNETLVETDLINSRVYAAIAIKFKDSCLQCHQAELKNGTIYADALAGTLVLELPAKLSHLSAQAVLTFAIIFVMIFIISSIYISHRQIQKYLISPLDNLNLKINKLRLTRNQTPFEWHRNPQPLIEMDEIDAGITEHIQRIRTIYDNLDAMLVTEKQSGLFHKERFYEVLRYEMFRTRRYQKPFSLLLVTASHIKTLNAAAKNMETEKPGTKYFYFGRALNHETRDTDLAFHLEDQLFAVIAPETDAQGIAQVRHLIKQRIINTQFELEQDLHSRHPQYELTMKLGTVSYSGDEINVKQLINQAIDSMNRADEFIGHYPIEEVAKSYHQIDTEEDEEDKKRKAADK